MQNIGFVYALLLLLVVSVFRSYCWFNTRPHRSAPNVEISVSKRPHFNKYRSTGGFVLKPTATDADVDEERASTSAGVENAKKKKIVSVTKTKVQQRKEQLKREAATKQLTMYNRDYVQLDLYEMFNSSTIKALLNLKVA